ncbi:30S ribosomal protein S19e [Candidatus Woesearchaeota archaeon]|nr:30S ribosomal protein S19e [Candidatus Woesearchaeota archaeon]
MTDTKLEEAKPIVEAEKKDSKQDKQGDKHDIVTALSVDANQLIEILAKELQGIPQIKPPIWAPFVKTGANKERPPARKDWWHVRAASVLRTVARLGPVGTSKLRTKYGGKHSRGYKSERFVRGSGSIIRKAMQQLEKAGLVKQAVKGVHKGRIITEKAAAILRTTAHKAMAEPRKAKAPKMMQVGSSRLHSPAEAGLVPAPQSHITPAAVTQSPTAKKKEAKETKKQ